ncbi:MAG TPA: lysylphosphatidylglycerol synthase transmembrane domain-containing protein [Verrucomicrobiae bacterium]|nr:lysylphosphatidylglycerol synthase transmembrane domain-containing protein [Verrucomicrobiae bacterium]
MGSSVSQRPQGSARERSKGRAVRWARIIISYGIAAACLYWSLHDIHFSELERSIAHMNWWWVAAAVLLQFITYICVAWEWQILLRPVGKLSLVRITQAVLSGRFANDVLPVQLGYLVRIYLVARWMRKGFAEVVPSLLVERLWDGLWLAAGIGITTLFVPLPPNLLRARDILGMVILVGTGLVAFVIFRPRKWSLRALDLPIARRGVAARVLGVVARLSEGVRGIGKARLLPALFSLSMVKLLLQALSYYAMLLAYDLRLPLGAGLAVFLIAYLGVCVPSTPASAGIFQVCSIAGLRVFGIAKTPAAGFSLVAFIALTLPLSIAGFFALAQSGLSLKEIRKDAAGGNCE